MNFSQGLLYGFWNHTINKLESGHEVSYDLYKVDRQVQSLNWRNSQEFVATNNLFLNWFDTTTGQLWTYTRDHTNIVFRYADTNTYETNFPSCL